MKTCHTCQIQKLKTDFSKHNQKKDGLDPNCKSCRNAKAKKYYQDNAEKIKQSSNSYYHNNKEKAIKYQKEYKANKRKTDKFFVLQRRLRNRLYYALKKAYWKKNTHFSQYIGCDKKTLLNHIESQFIQGMTWENYGEWHMDHIIPLSSAKNEEHLYKLCHYTNIQPLWAKDNLSKGCRI